MSRESAEWLNKNTLQGFTEKRGHAWHHDPHFQGTEPNHYPYAIPKEDVRRRLFGWTPVVGTEQTTVTLPDGTEVHLDFGRKILVHPDTLERLGNHSEDYAIHDYEEWLLNSVEYILDDGLQIGS